LHAAVGVISRTLTLDMSSLFFAAVSVAAVVIAVAGLVTLVSGFLRLSAAALTRGWPHVPGTILTSTVEERVSTSTLEDLEDDDAPPREVRVFKACVTYRYKVGEKELEGSTLASDELETSLRATAEQLAARYPVGASVEVFHAPTEPSRSVLQPGVSGASAIIPAVGAALVVLGCAMFGIAWKISGH